MKHKKLAILALVALAALTACSGGGKNTGNPPADAAAQTGASQENTVREDNGQEAGDQEESGQSGIEVDKGLLNVEITLPASFFQGDAEQAIENAKSQGVKEAVINEDGSVTYKMSKATHEKMLKEMRDQAAQTIGEFVQDEDFASIKDIKYNDKLSEFTMIVDREAYENSFDGFVILGLALQGMLYQSFDGVPSEKQKVTINVQDQATGEIFHTAVYPEQNQSP